MDRTLPGSRSEKDPQKRLAILVEIEAAARKEQEDLKLRLRPHVQRYKVLTKNASRQDRIHTFVH